MDLQQAEAYIHHYAVSWHPLVTWYLLLTITMEHAVILKTNLVLMFGLLTQKCLILNMMILILKSIKEYKKLFL